VNPYYTDEYVTIFHADFREVTVTPNLIIADPPFNIWEKIAKDVAKINYKSLAAFTNWQNREYLQIFGRPRSELVWTFNDGRWISHKLPRLAHETILVYGETGSAYVGRSMKDVAPISKGRGAVGKDKYPEPRVWYPRERAILDSYMFYPRHIGKGAWSKPPELIEKLVEWLSAEGELVFDPFMGSGSIASVCKTLGRHVISCEISEELCESAATRLIS
jgi:hypothetical protein